MTNPVMPSVRTVWKWRLAAWRIVLARRLRRAAEQDDKSGWREQADQCPAMSLGGTRCVLNAGHGDIHQGGPS